MCIHNVETAGTAPGCRIAEALYTVKVLSSISSTVISAEALGALADAKDFLQSVKDGRPTAAADGLSVTAGGQHYTACELAEKGACSHEE